MKHLARKLHTLSMWSDRRQLPNQIVHLLANSNPEYTYSLTLMLMSALKLTCFKQTKVYSQSKMPDKNVLLSLLNY